MDFVRGRTPLNAHAVCDHPPSTPLIDRMPALRSRRTGSPQAPGSAKACLVVATALLAGLGPPALARDPVALECGGNGAGEPRQAESARYVVAYRVLPEPIEVGRHFSLEVLVCAKPGAPSAKGLRVDARMPAHGHGMNYRTRVTRRQSGAYVADGLLLHMPGRWELVFDVEGPAGVDRITHGVVLE